MPVELRVTSGSDSAHLRAASRCWCRFGIGGTTRVVVGEAAIHPFAAPERVPPPSRHHDGTGGCRTHLLYHWAQTDLAPAGWPRPAARDLRFPCDRSVLDGRYLVKAEPVQLGPHGGAAALFRAVPMRSRSPGAEFLFWVGVTGAAVLSVVSCSRFWADSSPPIYRLRDAASRLRKGCSPAHRTNDELEVLDFQAWRSAGESAAATRNHGVHPNP
jgi:hypothetical protein